MIDSLGSSDPDHWTDEQWANLDRFTLKVFGRPEGKDFLATLLGTGDPVVVARVLESREGRLDLARTHTLVHALAYKLGERDSIDPTSLPPIARQEFLAMSARSDLEELFWRHIRALRVTAGIWSGALDGQQRAAVFEALMRRKKRID